MIEIVNQDPTTTVNKAKMVYPSDGSTLASTSQKFVWDPAGGSEYQLAIGTSLGATDIYSQNLGSNYFDTVNNLPSNGITLYVMLWSKVNGTWQSNNYTYKAFTDTPKGGKTSSTGNTGNTGNTSTGNTSTGNTSTGNTSTGNTSTGNTSTGNTSSTGTSALCPSGTSYSASFLGGNSGSVCLSINKVSTPSGDSKLRGTASWRGFATSASSAEGATFTFAWENYESDITKGILFENDPAHGALFVLAYAFPSSTCSGGASFFAVIEMANAASMKDLGASLTFTPLFGQICGTKITSLTQYTLTKQ